MTRVQLLCRTYFSSLVLLLMSNIGSALITGPQLDAITGGGVAYSYIRVLPDGFLLKAIVFTVC